ncbi:excisionase family DNA binding domain-containing protein [Dorea sp. 5-2]|nr:excisionase family DNA binding domain-containing protein [Dorea sp. 5-2]
MLDYISVKEAAEKWGISERRVQKLCEGNRIEGVVRFGHTWMIPRKAEKPADQRRIQKKDKGGNISCITHN